MDIGGVLKKCPDCKGTGRILDEVKEEKAEFVPRGTFELKPINPKRREKNLAKPAKPTASE
jgi:hypothetical protein